MEFLCDAKGPPIKGCPCRFCQDHESTAVDKELSYNELDKELSYNENVKEMNARNQGV